MREHERQPVSEWPGEEELRRRSATGWKLVALEWEREAGPRNPAIKPHSLAIPYGLRVSGDGFHLEDDPQERAVIVTVLDSIVDDRPLSFVVAELNRAGFLTREGADWTVSAVFELLPRLIEAGPSIFSSADWAEQRAHRAHRF